MKPKISAMPGVFTKTVGGPDEMTSEASLPPALTGKRQLINLASAGTISYYNASPEYLPGYSRSEVPLLLIHSVNAAASAYEMKPLYEHFRQRRPVYAIDLPGFGFSERRDIEYSPRLMTDAVHAIVAEIATRYPGTPIDAMALSLSSEFLARAAVEAPQAFRSLALTSPTGFESRNRLYGEPGASRELKALSWLLSFKPLGRFLFSLLSRPGTIRYFLERTWGNRQIDPGLWNYSTLTAAQDGAPYAPLRFLARALFSADISRIYEGLRLPVWMSHGVRGDFAVYRGADLIAARRNWQINVFQTGAMPQFEMQQHFISVYKRFLQNAGTNTLRAILARPDSFRPARISARFQRGR